MAIDLLWRMHGAREPTPLHAGGIQEGGHMDPAPERVKPALDVGPAAGAAWAARHFGRGGMEDDDLPRPKPRRVAELKLDTLGVAELEDYVAELRAEIVRAESEIGRKRGHRSAADAVFGRR
jgi:uncharacterized small protein (DUF1192 family)